MHIFPNPVTYMILILRYNICSAWFLDTRISVEVDILISKNQVLQILYLKHIKLHKLPWIEIHENLIPTKLNNDTVKFCCYIKIVNKNIPYHWPAGSQQVLSSIYAI